MAKSRKRDLLGFVDRLEGDKIIWMIVLLLLMISILAISSSTSRLALMDGTSRPEIIREQLFIVAAGLLGIVIVYNIRSIRLIKWFSKNCFLISVTLLLCLALHIKLPFVRAIKINDAYRSLLLFGKIQLHVFEVVKVLMVMYLAWAIEAYNDNKLSFIKFLLKFDRLQFTKADVWQKIICIYAPVVIVFVLTMTGSVSSALFLGVLLFATMVIGGLSFKEVTPLFLVGIVAVTVIVGISLGTDGKHFERVYTGFGRIERFVKGEEKELLKLDPKTKEFKDRLDKLQQPIAAKVAISEGGFIGKGPGKSTQRYVVPIMFEDYMFSFLVEEYGILGGFIVLLLYVGLLARGSIVVKYCNTYFAKITISGLILLITGQAMMHILINVGLMPTTGQTLPLISHGNSSLLCFCFAFGIILSISRMAKKKMEKDAAMIVPIVETDEVKESLKDLEEIQ